MQPFLDHLERIIHSNTLRDWLLAGAVFLATFLVVPFIRGRIRARQHHWRDIEQPALELMALLAARTNRLVLLSAALFFVERLLHWPTEWPKERIESIDKVFHFIIVVGVSVQLATWSVTALRFAIERRYARSGRDDAGGRASVGVLLFVGQVIVWAVFTLLALDNLHYPITTLLAGMGVGGIAIALAVQTILGDLFGSMSIALDKPFVVGDLLKIDDIEGTVEHIGIKSTRLRSTTGEQVILANADVLKSRVRNLGRMAERRVQLKLGIAYDTPHDLVDRISAIVQQVVEAQPDARFVLCALARLGDHALEFEAIFFVRYQSPMRHADTVDVINRGLLRAFAAAGVKLAYPTQRVLVEHKSEIDNG